MQYISSLLTHWIGRLLQSDEEKYEVLIDKILRKRELLFSRNPIAFSSKYGGFTEKESWGVKMVCFTDMPLSMSQAHCDRYSQFGVAFFKHALANSCLCPVAYAMNPFIYKAYSYLYHNFVALKALVDDKTLIDGAPFSFDKSMQSLHTWIAWSQDYSEEEFARDEHSILANPSQADFFKDKSAFYYEREWRAVYRPGDKFCWATEHDNDSFFQFDASSIRYVIVPPSFIERARKDISSIFKSMGCPLAISFDELKSGNRDE
jgi:hypothetical protein